MHIHDDTVQPCFCSELRQFIREVVSAELESQLRQQQASPLPRRYAGKMADLSLAHLRPAKPFDHKWSEGDVEHFTKVQAGPVRWGMKGHNVKIGIANRQAMGKWRTRIDVWVDGHLACEFTGADDEYGGLVASLIRSKGEGKYLAPDAEVPPEYSGMDVRPYKQVVSGAGAKDRLAVVCRQDDWKSIVRHAMIRFEGKQ